MNALKFGFFVICTFILGVSNILAQDFSSFSPEEFTGTWVLKDLSKEKTAIFKNASVPKSIEIKKASIVTTDKDCYLVLQIPQINSCSKICRYPIQIQQKNLEATVTIPTKNMQHWGSIVFTLRGNEASIQAVVENPNIVDTGEKVITGPKAVSATAFYEKE